MFEVKQQDVAVDSKSLQIPCSQWYQRNRFVSVKYALVSCSLGYVDLSLRSFKNSSHSPHKGMEYLSYCEKDYTIKTLRKW